LTYELCRPDYRVHGIIGSPDYRGSSARYP